MPVVLRRGRRRNQRPGFGPRVRYLARDTFAPDKAAALAASEPWTNGGRNWTVVGSDQYRSGGKLVGPANVTTRTLIDNASWARQAGRAFVYRGWRQTATPSANGWTLGCRNTTSASITGHQAWFGNNGNLFTNVNGQTGRVVEAALTNDVDYDFAIVLNAVGCVLLWKRSDAAQWTLSYVDPINADANLYPEIAYNNSANLLDGVDVADGVFVAPTVTVASGAPGSINSASGDGFHMAQCVGTGTQELKFRVQDALNYWAVERGAANVRLLEYVAGSPTARATGSNTAADGEWIAALAVGASIRIYRIGSNGVVVAPSAYASASNFQSATGLGMSDEANYANLRSYPRTCSLAI
jgi:hypothetical protein